MAEEGVVVVEAAEEAVAAAEVVVSKMVKTVRTKVAPNIRVPNTLTSLLESGVGALCTSDGGGGHFSVLSPAPAPGRTSSPRSRTTSETVASSSLK